MGLDPDPRVPGISWARLNWVDLGWDGLVWVGLSGDSNAPAVAGQGYQHLPGFQALTGILYFPMQSPLHFRVNQKFINSA